MVNQSTFCLIVKVGTARVILLHVSSKIFPISLASGYGSTHRCRERKLLPSVTRPSHVVQMHKLRSLKYTAFELVFLFSPFFLYSLYQKNYFVLSNFEIEGSSTHSTGH